jgi:hypothetical protein
MEGLSEVLATADVLYGLLPEAFTSARDERVRGLRRDGSAARALAVKDLRRPSVAAWLVNALVRHRQQEVEQLLQVGRALRAAQEDLDADQLRDLNRQRHAVLATIRREAAALAGELGRPVGEQVLSEVEGTLRAAVADPSAASAVRCGRLTTSLTYAGFGPWDGSDLGAALPAPVGSTPAPSAARRPPVVSPRIPVRHTEPRQLDGHEAAAHGAAVREATRAVKAAEDAAQRAEGAALAVEQHRDVLLRRAGTAQERLEAAHAQVAELESLVASARAATSTAAAAWAPLHAEADAATIRADAARGLADSARVMLGSARAHLAHVEPDAPSTGAPPATPD